MSVMNVKSPSLEGHISLYSRELLGEKPYGCHECGAAFSGKSSLDGHQRSHMGENPYELMDMGESSPTCHTSEDIREFT